MGKRRGLSGHKRCHGLDDFREARLVPVGAQKDCRISGFKSSMQSM